MQLKKYHQEILLYLEDKLEYTDNQVAMEHSKLSIGKVADDLSLYAKEDVQYTIEKLCEAKYIRLVNVKYDNQKYMITGYIDDITWEGFNFLNNIREKSIWEATISGAKKVGAMSISAINMIAFEIVKNVVTNSEVINKIVAGISWGKRQ